MEGSEKKDTRKGAAALREEHAREKQAARDADRESLLKKAADRAGEPVSDREKEKQASRDADREDLLSGRKTPAELYQENSHFAGLRVRINYKNCNDFACEPLRLHDLVCESSPVQNVAPNYDGPKGRVVAISYGADALPDGSADAGFGNVGESLENPYYDVLFEDGRRAGFFGDGLWLLQSAGASLSPDETDPSVAPPPRR
jgi:hypothetical protein